MQTFDQSLQGLLRRNLVTYEEALRWATNLDEFKLKVQGIASATDEARDQMASEILGSAAKPDITRFSR
jgi:twitching motility protein PilT